MGYTIEKAPLEGGTVTGEALEAMRPYVEITAAKDSDYTGSRKVYLTIYRTKLTKGSLKVDITEGTDIYTGKQVRPEVTVKLGSKTLTEGKDYTLAYGANIVAGKKKGSITVSGTGLYGGNVTVKFDIKSRGINKEGHK